MCLDENDGPTLTAARRDDPAARSQPMIRRYSATRPSSAPVGFVYVDSIAAVVAGLHPQARPIDAVLMPRRTIVPHHQRRIECGLSRPSLWRATTLPTSCGPSTTSHAEWESPTSGSTAAELPQPPPHRARSATASIGTDPRLRLRPADPHALELDELGEVGVRHQADLAPPRACRHEHGDNRVVARASTRTTRSCLASARPSPSSAARPAP